MDLNARRLKNIYYVAAVQTSYVLPITYFMVRYGLTYTEEKVKVVFPIIIISVLLILKISADIPKWVSNWEPSFKKGIIKAIPKMFLFIFFMTLGYTLKYLVEQQITIWYFVYFETIIILFGGLFIGSLFEAMHLKYKELYLISKGYVLGVVNK
jgi:hypothetical protein